MRFLCNTLEIRRCKRYGQGEKKVLGGFGALWLKELEDSHLLK
jgi:SPX domain protein involved in polyphosphate accumulation